MQASSWGARTVLFAAAAALFALAACPDQEPSTPSGTRPGAASYKPPPKRLNVTDELRADRAAPRSPADGAGKAWLEAGDDGSPARAQVRTAGRWTLVFEAGPLGIAENGTLLMLVGPYWNWDDPQLIDEAARGFTRVTTEAAGVELECDAPGGWTLAMRVRGRALQQGERIRIEYGAGERGAKSDDWAERESRFWLRVDGDGDGVSGLLADAPALDVEAGLPARLLLQLSSTTTGTVEGRLQAKLSAAVVDRLGNACRGVQGAFEWLDWPAGLTAPAELRLEDQEWSATEIAIEVQSLGIYRLQARLRLSGAAGQEPGRVLEAESNPLMADGKARILWGDLHGHTNLSDGTGTPEDWFGYARKVAGLDFAALTDHDHWGMRFLDETPDLLERLRQAVRAANEPRAFTSLHGYEWTSWVYGHRHVLFFDDQPLMLSSLDEATDDPAELWNALRGKLALTFAHHSAGGPIGTDWSFLPDPLLEPVTEIVSVHGSSEAADTPLRIYAPLPGNFVRDQLERGLQLGFVGSGDGHDGHPGLAHFGGASGGLAAVHSEANTREALLQALRARACYGTSGPRIVLRAELSGQPMGARIDAASMGQAEQCLVRVAAVSPLRSLDLIRGAVVAASVDCGGARDFETSFALDGLHAGEFVYVRAVQDDGHFACSSPFFVD